MSAQLTATWWSWTSAVSVQAALLAIAVVAFDLWARRRVWPALRAALWCALLLRLVVPPGWSAGWSLSAPLIERTGLAGVVSTSADAPASTAWIAWAFGAWCAGALSLATLDVVRAVRLKRALAACPELEGRARRALERLARELGLARAPRAVVSDRFGSPALVGIVAPCVVVPRELVGSIEREAELEHALLHELTHLARRDPLRALAVRSIAILYWFHPAVWIAAKRLDELRELGCDAAIARRLRERTREYRTTLVLAAGRRVLGPRGATASGFVSPGSVLLLRLAWLDRPSWRFARLQRASSALAFAFTALFVVPMACRVAAELEPDVQRALERLQRAAASDERQNCLEVQAAARILVAHQAMTGEDLFARIR